MSSIGKVSAIIEARMASTRLPGKVLIEVAGKPFLQHMIERVRRVPRIADVIVATTDGRSCDPIADLCKHLGVSVFRGSEEDVMDRVKGAAQAHDVDTIVELTGDCPLIDPLIIDDVIQAYNEGNCDYAANIFQSGYPLGMECQVFSTDVLVDAVSRTDDPDDREHVSLYIYRNPERYRIRKVLARKALLAPKYRLTLDTPDDLEVISAVFDTLYPLEPEFGLDAILAFLFDNPAVADLNVGVAQKRV
ncbi:MAG: spore coat biosynthesis protein F [Muricauda sp. TMED12]|nr:MAG: spore coat biosynthesis protein F [Muricauda sp. TMED12]